MFDVIIPTKNRPNDLQNLLDSISIQTLMPSKIIIVDQSTEKLAFNKSTLSSEIEIIHIHDTNISGLCAAKNLGVSKSTSDIIFFFDDDIILDADFFEIIIRHFADNQKYYGICGRQKNSKSSRLKIAFFSFFHIGKFKDIRKKCNSGYVKKDLVKTNVLPGGITAYRKEVFEDFLFDEMLIKYCLGEDMDFSYRASKKYKLAFATKALALHNHSTIGRYDPIEAFACKVAGYAYFYKKNMGKSIKERFSYFMVRFGIWADAIIFTLSHRSLDAFKGIKKGKRYLRDNFKGVPFIDYDKLTESEQ